MAKFEFLKNGTIIDSKECQSLEDAIKLFIGDAIEPGNYVVRQANDWTNRHNFGVKGGQAQNQS